MTSLKESCKYVLQVARECDECRETLNSDSFFCLHCPGHICDKCKVTHTQLPIHRHHKILPRTHPDVIKRLHSLSSCCKFHPENQYTAFCNNCRCLCCEYCMSEEHSKHLFSSIDCAVEDTKEKLAKFIDSLQTQILPATRDRQKLTVERIDWQRKRKGENFEKLKRKVECLKKSLDDMEQEMTEKLNFMEKASEESLKGEKAEVDKKVQHLSGLYDECQNNMSTLTGSDLIDFFLSLPEIESLKVPFHPFPSLVDFQESETIPTAEEIIGKITDDSKPSSLSDCELYDTNDGKVLSIKKLHTTLSPYQMMSRTQNNLIWIKSVREMTLCDDNNQHILQISTKFDMRDSVVLPTGGFITNEIHSKVVKRVQYSGDVEVLLNTAPMQPNGIAMNREGQIVIGLQTAYRVAPIKLSVYNDDCSCKIQEIENDESGKPLFRKEIYRIAQNAQDDYVVTDKDRVVCVDIGGKFRWDYNVEWATAIACDRYGNTVVCDHGKQEIILLDCEGKLVRCILSRQDGIDKPRSVAIDTSGRLWVGQQNEQIWILKYLI